MVSIDKYANDRYMAGLNENTLFSGPNVLQRQLLIVLIRSSNQSCIRKMTVPSLFCLQVVTGSLMAELRIGPEKSHMMMLLFYLYQICVIE